MLATCHHLLLRLILKMSSRDLVGLFLMLFVLEAERFAVNLSFDSPLSITQVNLLIDLILHPNYGHIRTTNCCMILTIFFSISIAKYRHIRYISTISYSAILTPCSAFSHSLLPAQPVLPFPFPPPRIVYFYVLP